MFRKVQKAAMSLLITGSVMFQVGNGCGPVPAENGIVGPTEELVGAYFNKRTPWEPEPSPSPRPIRYLK
jgi:hypothetical protein